MRTLLPKQIKDIYTLADDGASSREIARRSGVDRKTIRKYLAMRAPGATEQGQPPQKPLAPGAISALQRTEGRIETMSAHLDDVVAALLESPQDDETRSAYLPLLHGFCKVLAEHRETHALYSTTRAHEGESTEDQGSFIKTLLAAFDAADLTEDQRRKIHEQLNETPTTDA